MFGLQKIIKQPLMNIENGETFGEDNLLFNEVNSYTVRAISNKCTLLCISYPEIRRELKRWLPIYGD